MLDPNSQSSNLATNAFDRVNLYLTAVASYDIGGLPVNNSSNICFLIANTSQYLSIADRPREMKPRLRRATITPTCG